jgi:hypothetical protein
MALGSGIREKSIPDPGVKKAPDPGSATLTANQSMVSCTHDKYFSCFSIIHQLLTLSGDRDPDPSVRNHCQSTP